jgi:choline-sulfatase
MPPPLRSHDDDGHPRPRGLLDDRLAKGGVAFEPGDVARLRANYAGNVTLIDDQVGELLRVLGERGELDTTVIAFVSDHGEMNGDHGLLYKQTFLDPAVRVPFLIRPASTPGGARGAVAPGIVELMDIGATLVELAGGRQPPSSDARSVVPLLADPRRPHRAAALSELRRERMLVRPDWKTALNAEGHVYLLYHREEDREETRNLAGLPRYSEVERELRIQIRRLVRSTR